jgi:hypothetical protein
LQSLNKELETQIAKQKQIFIEREKKV